mmetsp:Transcript_49619/g.124428  ORF Transcript_49619/g.124428 Transcript_49619/m.124428 type:complete len:290 (-) Transcript_49619:445-1314(-)
MNIVLTALLGVWWSICGYLWFFGVNDGQTFCANAAGRAGQPAPKFVFEDGAHKNKGGQACVEDIVAYANEYRAGADELVGTEDDQLDLQGHFDLIQALLASEYSLAYFANSPWHLNHNAAVLGQMRMLYADGNEYILIFGNPTPSAGYSGKYPYDCYDFQIEGEQLNWLVGNLTNRVFTPNWKQHENPNAHFSMVLKAGTQKGYAQKGGGWMIEYGYGNLIPPFYDGVIMPTVFITNDWTSLWVSVRYFAEGVIMSFVRKALPTVGLAKTGMGYIDALPKTAPPVVIKK